MFIVVSYDITDDRRRGKVAKLLEGYGVRQQYSVFECEISERRLDEMMKKIEGIIDKTEDSVRIYRLCAYCRTLVTIQGRGEIYQEKLYTII